MGLPSTGHLSNLGISYLVRRRFILTAVAVCRFFPWVRGFKLYFNMFSCSPRKLGEDSHFDSEFSKGLKLSTSSSLPKPSRRFFRSFVVFPPPSSFGDAYPLSTGISTVNSSWSNCSANKCWSNSTFPWIALHHSKSSNHHLGEYLLLFPSILCKSKYIKE